MSNLKVLRGSFARQLFTCAKTFRNSEKGRVHVRQFPRALATQVAPSLDNNILNSPWGEIQVGNETLTEYIFADFELWADKPSLETLNLKCALQNVNKYFTKLTKISTSKTATLRKFSALQKSSSKTCGMTGRSYDYGMMRMMIERCASALLSALRLSPGDRIGLILPNIPEFAVLIYGAMRAGIVVTFANPLYTAEEMRRQFSDCNVKALATIEMFMPLAENVAQGLKDFKGIIWVGGDDDKAKGIFGLRSLLMADHSADLPTLNADDVCLIPYSSGTTGMPKGVMLTHKNLVSNLKQLHFPKIMKYEGEKGKGEVMLSVPPFFHIYGFNGILNYNLTLGYHVISIPKFTPEDYIKCLVQYKPTTLFVVPSLLAFLATHPMVTRDHLESVETIMVGAAPTTDTILEKFLLKCSKTKDQVRLLQGYGMTESSPVSLMTPYIYPHGKVGSVGQLICSTQGRVVSLATGEALPPHQSGELWIRGPQVMKGYWNNEVATKETIDSEGWLHTGDVAYYDEDFYFYIVDRTKELIKVKGNQVSPTEIESVVMEMQEVADVAVVGMPDHLAGELPKAFVVIKPKCQLTEKQVYDFVAEKLTKYKHLDGGVAFLDAIPRNVAGKINRNELKVLGRKK